MKNHLSDLNNHLFAQLERLGEEGISKEKLILRADLVRLNQMNYSKTPTQLKPSVLALAKLKTRLGELSRKKVGAE